MRVTLALPSGRQCGLAPSRCHQGTCPGAHDARERQPRLTGKLGQPVGRRGGAAPSASAGHLAAPQDACTAVGLAAACYDHGRRASMLEAAASTFNQPRAASPAALGRVCGVLGARPCVRTRRAVVYEGWASAHDLGGLLRVRECPGAERLCDVVCRVPAREARERVPLVVGGGVRDATRAARCPWPTGLCARSWWSRGSPPDVNRQP